MQTLIDNMDKIHTTALGEGRIKKNLALTQESPLQWCKKAIFNADLAINLGKNWYVYYKGVAVTINAKSFTIITAHKLSPKIRKMEESEYQCLPEFLYQAIYVKNGECVPQREIINNPNLYIYIKDFGSQAGNIGAVAGQNGQIIGAAWTRIIPAYGHIDNNTPEIAIALFPEFRGYGIGKKLMEKMFVLLKTQGYTKTSLSVQKENPAIKLYIKLGYKIVEKSFGNEDCEDCIMIKHL